MHIPITITTVVRYPDGRRIRLESTGPLTSITVVRPSEEGFRITPPAKAEEEELREFFPEFFFNDN